MIGVITRPDAFLAHTTRGGVIKLKALTLTQPYATFVAEGIKRWETRSWPTRHRGPLAIHSASSFNGLGGWRKAMKVVDELPSQHRDLLDLLYDRDRYPMGQLVAVTWVEDVDTTEHVRPYLAPEEILVGDYTPGRYAWKLREPVAFAPRPARGFQGLWNVDDALIPEFAHHVIRHGAVA